MKIINGLVVAGCLFAMCSLANAQTIVSFNDVTLGGSGNLGVTTLTLEDVGGSGVDVSLFGSDGFPTDDPANAAELFLGVLDGTEASGLEVSTLGVASTGNDNGVQSTERLNVVFSQEVLVTQIVIAGFGRSDDVAQFLNMADNFDFTNGPIALSFDTLGTETVAELNAAGLDNINPAVGIQSSDGNDLLLSNGDTFAAGLIINFDTPVNTDQFLFSADRFSPFAAGAGLHSITFQPVPVDDGCLAPVESTRFRGIDVGTSSNDDFSGPDGVAASFNPGFVLNNTEAPVWLIFDYASAAAGSVEVTSQAGTPGLTMTVEFSDDGGATYNEIGTASESFSNFTTEVFPLSGASSDKIRVGWRQTGFTINFPWEVRVDAVSLCE